MFRHTLMLLLTTLLGTHAYSGYDADFELDHGRIRGGLRRDKFEFVVRPGHSRIKPRILYAPVIENDEIGSDPMDENSELGDNCEDSPTKILAIPFHRGDDYDDDDDNERASSKEMTDHDGTSNVLYNKNNNYNVLFKESRRIHYRPYGYGRFGNNINSNANNNVLGSRYRRISNWGPDRPNLPTYGVAKKYDKGHPSSNMNANANSNVIARRSNLNSNVNTNDLNYGGRAQGRRERKKVTDHDLEPMYIQNGHPTLGSWDKYPAPIYQPDRRTTEYPYIIGPREDESDDNDLIGPSENDNVNVNSNTNIMARRSNMNANKNSNFYSRIRRDVKKLSNDADGKENKEGASTAMTESQSSTNRQTVTEKWQNPRGAINHGQI